MDTTPRSDVHTGRMIDLDTLKVLAHPLRVQIFNTLSTYGSFTASGLGDRLGESSGATSYHLRQLAKHDLVREVEGKGTARERWWERTPGSIELSNREAKSSEAGRQASRVVNREFSISRERVLADFLEQFETGQLSEQWDEAAAISVYNAHVTAEQLQELNRNIEAVLTDFATTYRGQRIPGSRPVQIQFNSFPVVDGVEIEGAERPPEVSP